MTKWCIIGGGGIADRRVIPALLKDKSNVIVGIMERVEPLARELGKKYGVPAFCDVDEMLREVDCDAVYIGTPVFRHKPQALKALSYGKHVFIEKPMAMNADEAEEYFNIDIETRKRYIKLFERYGVDLVLTGHLHRCTSGRYGDMDFVTAGPAGKTLGSDASGVEIVKIEGDKVVPQYYPIEKIPQSVR